MELYATTVVWEGDGKLTVYDKTQGVQNVQRYLCGVFGMKPSDVRVMSPFVGGAFGSGLRPQYQVVLAVLAARALKRSVRLVLTRQQMYGLGYRPAMIQRIALGAKADGTLDAITHDAITVTSQYEDFHRQETGWSGLLYKCPNAKYAHKLARARPADLMRHARAGRRDRRLCARMRDGRARRRRSSSIRWSCACAAIRIATRTRTGPYSSKSLRECYRQGAEAFGWSKRNPEPRSMRDGSELVGWGMATGVWEALQMPIAVAHRADRQWPCRSFLRDLRHRHRHLHDHGAGRGRHARAAARQRHDQARRFDAAAIAGRRRIVDRGLGVEWHRDDLPRRSASELLRLAQADAEFAARRRDARRGRACGRQAREHGAMRRARCRSRTRCGTAAWTASSRRRPPPSPTTARTRTTRIRRCSPR